MIEILWDIIYWDNIYEFKVTTAGVIIFFSFFTKSIFIRNNYISFETYVMNDYYQYS